MRCYLFNRGTICYASDTKAYIRNIYSHEWVESYYCYFDLTHDCDDLIEEIDYDEENEQIVSLARRKGRWVAKSVVESYTPSKQVADYFERTGVTYEDIYVGDHFNSVKDMFLAMPDLIEGAPGSKEFLSRFGGT